MSPSVCLTWYHFAASRFTGIDWLIWPSGGGSLGIMWTAAAVMRGSGARLDDWTNTIAHSKDKTYKPAAHDTRRIIVAKIASLAGSVGSGGTAATILAADCACVHDTWGASFQRDRT
jgi:hypothetical protein